MVIDFQLDYESKGKALEHLSDQQVKDVVNKYYNPNYKTKDIIQEYNLGVRPNMLLKNLPWAITSRRCPYDEQSMIAKLEPRTFINETHNDYLYDYYHPLCPQCSHHEGGIRCNCPNCQAVRNQDDDNKRQAIVKLHQNSLQAGTKSLYSLDLYETLTLSALLKGFISNNQKDILSMEEGYIPFMPSQYRSVTVIKHLEDLGAIIVSADSPLDAFIYNDGNSNVDQFYPMYVRHQLNVKDPLLSHVDLLKYLMDNHVASLLDNKDDLKNIWKKIILDECEDFYLREVRTTYHLSTSINKKMEPILYDLMNDFSEGQIFYMIGREVRNSIEYYQKYHINKRHAINSITGNLARYGQLVLKNGWSIRPRKWPLPINRSQYSIMFFQDVLQVTDGGLGGMDIHMQDYLNDNLEDR